MADNVTADAGSGGAVFATDDVGPGVHYPITKITIGALDDAGTLLSGNNGAADAGTLRVTVASDSTGVLSVDDNGGALTVDNAGTFAVQISDTSFAVADGSALGEGILVQGDDGTDRKNINVDATTGDVQVDVTNTVTVDGSGVTQPVSGSVTVSGTVTSNLSATDNAVLDNIETNTDFGGVIGGGLQASALRVTLASDSTGVISVDDNGGVLSVDDNGGSLSVDDNGGSLTVDGTVTANLSATDNAVLDSIDAALAGTLTVTGGGGGTEYTEDVATANPIVGTATLVERDDALTTVTPVEGDWIGLRGSAEGALWVQDFNSDAIASSLAGTLTVDLGANNDVTVTSGTVTANLGATDNAVLDSIDSAVNGTLTVDLGANNDVTVTSGTVTANLSATDNAVLDTIDAVLDTINAKLVTGTVIGDVNLGATDNAVLDSIDSAVNGTLAVDLGVNNDVTVTSGTVTANAGTGTFTVDGSGVTQPISGSVTADLGANNDVTIDNSSVVATEDAASGGAAVGIPTMAVRDDSLSALTPIEGDYVPLRVGSTGALHVTGGGGGTEYNVSDAGPTVVTMSGAVRDDSLTTLTEVDGDATLLRVNSTGALHVTGGGGGTEYTEDVATADPIVGTATLMERDDALTTVTPIEGDWIGLRGSAEGALWTQDFNSDSMAADLSTLAAAVSTEMQVDVVTSALPTGASTAANQSTIIGHVDGIEGLLTTIDADTGAIKTAVEGTLAVGGSVANLVDTNNSTTSPLGGSATFTGTGTDVSSYSMITIHLYANVDSATDGMTFQFSTDDTNWDDVYTFTMDVSSSDTRRFQFPVTAQYFRVVYTNGGGAQSSFRVQTILHGTNALTSVHRLVDDVSPDRSAQVVKSALFAQVSGAGDFIPISSSASGKLQVSAELDASTASIGKLAVNDGVDIGDVTINNASLTVDGSAVTQPVSAASLPLPTGAATETTLSTVETNTDFGTVTGGGTEAGALRVTLANNSTGVMTVDGTGTFTVDGSAVTQPVSAASLPLPSGASTAANQSTANASLGNIDTNTSAGASHYRNVDANAEAEIKGSAGTLHWLHAMNMTAAVAYVHLYDATAAAVTPGTTTPNYTFPIPTQGDTNGAGFTLKLDQAFASGITIVVTTTIDGSTGDPGTNGVFINAGYT